MSTYTLISSSTLSATAANVTFSAIPATYTDLVIRWSARTNDTSVSAYAWITVNTTATGYSETALVGSGSAASSNNDSAQTSWYQVRANGNNSTANTFGSAEFYIPNYAGSTAKVMSGFAVTETNATAADMVATAFLNSSTTAISSIKLDAATGSTLWMSGSSFYLYGISNA